MMHCTYKPSSTANATLFLLSSFKYVNNLKTFVSMYYLNDLIFFLHYQIQIFSAYCASTRLGVQKCIFRASRARALGFSKACTHSQF